MLAFVAIRSKKTLLSLKGLTMNALCEWDVRHRGLILASGARPHRFDALHVCAAVVAGRPAGTVGKVTCTDGRVLYTLTPHPEKPGWVLSHKRSGEPVAFQPVPMDADVAP